MAIEKKNLGNRSEPVINHHFPKKSILQCVLSTAFEKKKTIEDREMNAGLILSS